VRENEPEGGEKKLRARSESHREKVKKWMKKRGKGKQANVLKTEKTGTRQNRVHRTMRKTMG